jgi:hypothetical protein
MVDFAWLGGILAAWLIIEIIKLVLVPKKQGLTERQADLLEELYHMHNVRDVSGKPMWYVDPKIAERQIEIIQQLQLLSFTIQTLIDSQRKPR